MSDERKTILAFLNEYKEIATAIGFFIGGVSWILGYFATQQDLDQLHGRIKTETEKAQCLLRLNVDWLAGEQLWKSSYDELVIINSQIRSRTPSPGKIPDPEFLRQMVALESRRTAGLFSSPRMRGALS